MNNANYLRTNEDYNIVLEEALSFHSDPIGLTTETPTFKLDTIIIKQNNTIILLLLALHKSISKLESKLEEKPETSKKLDTNIDNLIQIFGELKVEKKLNI